MMTLGALSEFPLSSEAGEPTPAGVSIAVRLTGSCDLFVRPRDRFRDLLTASTAMRIVAVELYPYQSVS